MKEMPIEWYKDRKLLAGVILVILSIILGLYSKGLLGLFFANLLKKLYTPFYLLKGLSIYVLSWALLFLGVFLVGWETIKIIQQRINDNVKKTYRYTKGLPKKGYDYTKELHKKGYDYTRKLHKKRVDRIAKKSKELAEKLK